MLRNIVQLSSNCLRGLNVVKVTNTNSYIQVQLYSRYTGRKHATIINEDELFDEPEAAYPEDKQVPVEKGRRRIRRESAHLRNENIGEDAVTKNKNSKKRNKSVSKEERKEKHLFTKLYENEKLLSPLMIKIKSKKQRKKMNKVLLEGTRLITDAIQTGMIPEMIIFSSTAEMLKLPLPNENIDRYKVPYRTIQMWSSLTSPSGMMGIFEIPDVEKFESPNSLPLTILCDNIRDPGNLGSILRAAAGVGCDKVILSRGCVDLWEPKVLRSAAGAHFRVPIYDYRSWEDIRHLLSPGSQFVVADNRVEGASFIDEYQTKPINLEDDQTRPIDLEDENADEDTESKPKKRTYEREDFNNKIAVVPYYSVDYTQGETVIIIGGETEGISYNSFQLTEDNKGIRVNVPLNNGVESLNSGMALSILAFEIKRQFLMAAEKVN